MWPFRTKTEIVSTAQILQSDDPPARSCKCRRDSFRRWPCKGIPSSRGRMRQEKLPRAQGTGASELVRKATHLQKMIECVGQLQPDMQKTWPRRLLADGSFLIAQILTRAQSIPDVFGRCANGTPTAYCEAVNAGARGGVTRLSPCKDKSMKRSATKRSARGMTRREFVGRTLRDRRRDRRGAGDLARAESEQQTEHRVHRLWRAGQREPGGTDNRAWRDAGAKGGGRDHGCPNCAASG